MAVCRQRRLRCRAGPLAGAAWGARSFGPWRLPTCWGGRKVGLASGTRPILRTHPSQRGGVPRLHRLQPCEPWRGGTPTVAAERPAGDNATVAPCVQASGRQKAAPPGHVTAGPHGEFFRFFRLLFPLPVVIFIDNSRGAVPAPIGRPVRVERAPFDNRRSGRGGQDRDVPRRTATVSNLELGVSKCTQFPSKTFQKWQKLAETGRSGGLGLA